MTTSTPCSTSRPRSTRLASSVVATVAFSVEPSHSPSGCLTPSVWIPNATTQQRPLSSIPSSISTARRRSSSGRDMSSTRFSRVRATNSRLTAGLARRAGHLVDLTADRLAGAGVAARGDAGEHPLEYHVGEPVARGEVRIGGQLDLALAVGGAGARPADRDPSTTERYLAILVAMAPAARPGMCLPFGATTSSTSASSNSCNTPSPTDAQRQQALLRGADELAEHLQHRRRQVWASMDSSPRGRRQAPPGVRVALRLRISPEDSSPTDYGQRRAVTEGGAMAEQDVTTMRNAYEAFNRADIPAVLEALDPQ